MNYLDVEELINQPYIDRKGVEKLLNISSNEARRVLHEVNIMLDTDGEFRIKRRRLSAPTWKVCELLHIDCEAIREQARRLRKCGQQ